uniref:Uncharacterized protein n=1 Tax=Arundo donax TaxID=35708 RepID=A0A0A9DV93_ARUDO
MKKPGPDASNERKQIQCGSLISLACWHGK